MKRRHRPLVCCIASFLSIAPACYGGESPISKNISYGLLNVLSFGAKGDGVSDDTAAFEAANTAAMHQGAQGYGDRAGTIYVPSGHYLVRGIDLGPSVGLVGDGSKATMISLENGSDRSLLRISAPPPGAAEPFSRTMSYSGIRGVFLNGQGPRQHGISYGIEITDGPPDTYGGSAKLNDVVVLGATSGGIYVGRNRNWMVAENVASLSNSGPAWILNGFDHRLSSCDGSGQAASKRPVLDIQSGGNNTITGCNFYISGEGAATVAISQYVTGFVDFFGCSIDDGDSSLVYVAAPSAGVSRPIRFFGGVLDKANRRRRGGSYITMTGRSKNDLEVYGTTFARQGQNPGDFVVHASDVMTTIILSHINIAPDAITIETTNAHLD